MRRTAAEDKPEIPYMEIKAFMDGQETIETLQERITGRFIAETITDPDTGEVVIEKNHMCTPKRAAAVMAGIEETGQRFHQDPYRPDL